MLVPRRNAVSIEKFSGLPVRIRAGSEEAFEELVRGYQERLFGYALRLLLMEKRDDEV